MEYIKEIFTIFNDNLINHIPSNIDKKNPELFFAYYYEHFALSAYEAFSNPQVISESFTDPLYSFLLTELKNYEKKHGKIKDVKKKWLIMHLLTLRKCSKFYNMLFMESVIDKILDKSEEIESELLMYYINQFNSALMADSGLALVPRPYEISKTKIDKSRSFNDLFNDILNSITKAAEIFSKSVKVDEIKGLEDYIDMRFLKYISKYEVLSEYFSGVIVLKREVLLKSAEDNEDDANMKYEMLEYEIEKFIDNTCNIADECKKELKDDLVGLIDSL